MKILRLLILFLFLLLVLWISYCFITLPDLSGLGNKTRAPSISVLDDNKKIMGSSGDVYAGSTDFKNISESLIKTVVFIEDKRFYNHFGIDIKGLIRAIFYNIKEGRYAQGASTITQQLSKLIFLDSKKTLSRKMRELIIAFYLEYNFTKEDILTMYLNRVYFGSGLYGIKAASRRYFSNSPEKLNLAESAILAGTLKAPSKLSFLVNKNLSIERAKLIINLLFKENIISEKEKNLANKNLGSLLVTSQNSYQVRARYFIDWIYTQTPGEILKSKKDLLIKSTLSTKIQKIVNEAVDLNLKNENKNIETAVVVMNYNGAVKAMKGGRDWNVSKFNRATQSKRQVGSIFKTYVYLAALNKGTSINNIMLDTPIVNAAMGLSLPLSIGAAISSKKQVFSVTGDGSIELNIQELKTISHYQLNIKTFVINNGGYVSMQKWQDDFFDKNRLDTSLITGVGTLNFEKIAKAFDLKFIKISRVSEIKTKIKKIQKDKKPYLVEVITDPNQKIYGQKF